MDRNTYQRAAAVLALVLDARPEARAALLVERCGDDHELRAREAGWLQIEASHLVDKAPTFLLSDLTIGGLAATWLPGRLLDLQGANLSTQPWLLDEAPKLSLTSRDGGIGFDVDLASASRKGGAGRLQMHWKGLAVARSKRTTPRASSSRPAMASEITSSAAPRTRRTVPATPSSCSITRAWSCAKATRSMSARCHE